MGNLYEFSNSSNTIFDLFMFPKRAEDDATCDQHVAMKMALGERHLCTHEQSSRHKIICPGIFEQFIISSFFHREELAKKAEAERAALAAGPSTSSGEPDPKKAKTDSAGEGSESAAAAAGPPPSAGDGANKAPSDGSSGAGEKAAEGPPAVPVKVLVQRQIMML